VLCGKKGSCRPGNRLGMPINCSHTPGEFLPTLETRTWCLG
jgi:hypothetical protein